MATNTTDTKSTTQVPVFASRLDSYQPVPNLPQLQHASGQPDPKIPPPAPAWNPYFPVTPPLSLHKTPALVDCPSCGYRVMTRIDSVSGNTTHAWAVSLCICCCLGCLPYLASSLKDVDHYCGRCGVLIATWHNSGRVELAKPPKPKQKPGSSPQPAPQPQPQEPVLEMSQPEGNAQDTASTPVVAELPASPSFSTPNEPENVVPQDQRDEMNKQQDEMNK